MKNPITLLYYLLIYIFLEPKIKIGDKLNHYNSTCHGKYFNWKTGEWYFKISEGEHFTAISYSIEKVVRKKNKLKTV